MENPNAIELQHISKKFKIYSDKGWGLKERILFKDRNRYEERVVLNDLSFCVKKRGVYWNNWKKWMWKKYHIKTFSKNYIPQQRNGFNARKSIKPY